MVIVSFSETSLTDLGKRFHPLHILSLFGDGILHKFLILNHYLVVFLVASRSKLLAECVENSVI